MKPIKKQIELIDTILRIVSSWKSTNDINSATNHGDIGEELDTLKPSLDDNEYFNDTTRILAVEDYLSSILREVQTYGKPSLSPEESKNAGLKWLKTLKNDSKDTETE